MLKIKNLVLNLLSFFTLNLFKNKKSLNFYSLILLKYMLMPTKTNLIIKEKSCKQGAVKASSNNNRKIIFILLVLLYIRLTIVNLKKSSI